MAAIPVKRSTRRWDSNPRVVRKKVQPVALDDPEAHLRFMDEKQYRRHLWNEFAAFAKSHGASVVSLPDHSPVRIQVRLSDGEISPLEKAMTCLPRYPMRPLPTTAARLSHGIFETMRELEVHLWRDCPPNK
jgi:hypothetical protein